jgi:hypothetical protein
MNQSEYYILTIPLFYVEIASVHVNHSFRVLLPFKYVFISFFCLWFAKTFFGGGGGGVVSVSLLHILLYQYWLPDFTIILCSFGKNNSQIGLFKLVQMSSGICFFAIVDQFQRIHCLKFMPPTPCCLWRIPFSGIEWWSKHDGISSQSSCL